MPADVLYTIIGGLVAIIGFFIVRMITKMDTKVDTISDLRVSISSLEANMETTYARIVELTEQSRLIEGDVKDLEKLVLTLKEAHIRLEHLQKEFDKLEALVTETKAMLLKKG